ncbi:MAG: uracil-xanthine permease family protein [Clostridioides sp.]|nr:uracil-xanthine permease family protein [Clostridioides sp.]
MKKFIMAVQHLFAMFGATVLVPILTGFNPAVAICSAGVGTLIFHFCTKRKVPVFLGSSFAFIPVVIAAKKAYGGDMAYAQGGIIVAGLIYLIIALVAKLVGVETIKKYFPPQVTGAMIIVIGLNLLPTAITMASEKFIIAGVTLATAILINIFGKGFIKQLGILIAVFMGYGVCLVLGYVDVAKMTEATMFSIPQFTLPKFGLQAIVMIAPVVLATVMEHIGDITTNGTVVGQNFIEDPGLNRTLLGDGLASIFAGFIGGPANTTYGENTAVLAITKNYDPSILRITACIAIVLSFVGKFGGFLQSIPGAVMGGVSVMLFSMITFVGFKTIRDNHSFDGWKNIAVILLILLVGLGTTYAANYGIHIGIPVGNSVEITGLSLAALVGIIANRIINNADFKKEQA